jgi:hypothetical protein
MARIARLVVPGFPIMSRERGARRERVFFGEDDHALCRDPKERYGIELAYRVTQPVSKVGSGGSAALGLPPQCGANRLFIRPISKGRSGSRTGVHRRAERARSPSERPAPKNAVKTEVEPRSRACR